MTMQSFIEISPKLPQTHTDRRMQVIFIICPIICYNNGTDKNANCLQEFVNKRCIKCPAFAGTHAWWCYLCWSIAVWIMSCRKPDHCTIKHSFSSSTVFSLLR